MKVGVVSDVHNNVEALTYALEQLRDCDLLLGLGDLVSDYHVDPRIVEVACAAGLVNIVGNHEKSILLHPGSQIRGRLSTEMLAFLRSLPASREVELDGRHVHVAHGAPWDDPRDTHCEYVRAHDRAALERVGLAASGAAIVLLGHTHSAMAVRVNGTLVLNPGSCGEARTASGLSFARLDGDSGRATVFGIERGAPPEVLLVTEF